MRPGRDELRPVGVRISLPYISFDAFTWDRRKNELRPV